MILPGERLEDEDAPCRQMLFDLKAALESEGHTCRFTAKSQSQVGYATDRIQRLVAGCEADAWLVLGGKRELLEWFAARSVPTMALGGVTAGLRIAATGMETVEPFRAALRRLMELGHRRITFLAPAFLRDRGGSPYVRAMQEELAAGGLASGNYNVPDFDETPDGLRAVLRENFRVTPPTAVIVTYTTWLVNALAFLAGRGLHPGRDVSVLCLGDDLWLPWHHPAVAHFKGDEPRMLRHILQWIRNVARGREDVRQLRFPLRFVDGASIGPAPGTSARRR
jgi:DNA-binding LacI/PurR family transcriptional regulator